MVNRTILVDADVLAYSAASATEVALEWEPGYWTWYTPFEETKQYVLSAIDDIRDSFPGSDVVLALTDSAGNFRKRVLPTYKSNRSGTKRPLVLQPVRQWLIDEHRAYWRPGLEGDDIMGILATGSVIKGEKIILSPDKDMKSIPGVVCKALGEPVVEVSVEEADYYHLLQTLTGDPTDGYKGCPGVGKVGAEKILDAAIKDWLQTSFSGSHEARSIVMWEYVVQAYEKAGLTEEDALVQARVARILRAEDYDFASKTPILWNPR